MPVKVSMKKRATRKRRAPLKTQKALTSAIVKTHRKLEPTKEIRFENYQSLNGFSNYRSAYLTTNLASTFTQGTSLNQKEHSKLYIPGIQLVFVANNLDPNASKLLRLMVVRNKNPSDTLNITDYTDLYETKDFGPEASPTGKIDNMCMPLNTDVIRPYFDKSYVLPVKTEKGFYRKIWIPLKSVWTYKTVSSQLNCSNGSTYLIFQAMEYTNGALSNTSLDVQFFIRLFWKPYESLRSTAR